MASTVVCRLGLAHYVKGLVLVQDAMALAPAHYVKGLVLVHGVDQVLMRLLQPDRVGVTAKLLFVCCEFVMLSTSTPMQKWRVSMATRPSAVHRHESLSQSWRTLSRGRRLLQPLISAAGISLSHLE